MFGPNIIGKIVGGDGILFGWWQGTASGALSVGTGGDLGPSGGAQQDSVKTIDLLASMSSGVFGKSSTVQPPSIRVMPCIKS